MRISHLLPRKAEHGQSLVELAISLTMIILLLSGAVSFGMALFSFVSIRDAAQEGALYGSTHGDQSGTMPTATFNEICYRVENTSYSPVDLSSFTCNQGVTTGNNIDVEVVGSDCEGSVGGTANGVSVDIYYDYPIFMPYLGAILGKQSISLHATVTDTVLTPVCQ
jgi:hypothetical protein